MNQTNSPKEEIDAIAGDLRKAINGISQTCPSAVRTLLDPYLRMLSPSLADTYDTRFPVSVRRHPRDPESCSAEGRRFDLLIFHVGNAVLGYYAIVLSPSREKIETFKARVKLLMNVHAVGVDSFKASGNVANGFRLSPLAAKKDEAADAVSGQQSAPIATKANPGGGRGSGSPPQLPR